MALINAKVIGKNITSITALGKSDTAGAFDNVAVGDYLVLTGEKSFDPQMQVAGANLIASDLTTTDKFLLYEVTNTPITVTSGQSTYLYGFILR